MLGGVLGDFNAVLHPDERIGGEKPQNAEMNEFAKCLEECELQEVRSTSAFFTWTNKSVWSKIDRMVQIVCGMMR